MGGAGLCFCARVLSGQPPASCLPCLPGCIHPPGCTHHPCQGGRKGLTPLCAVPHPSPPPHPAGRNFVRGALLGLFATCTGIVAFSFPEIVFQVFNVSLPISAATAVSRAAGATTSLPPKPPGLGAWPATPRNGDCACIAAGGCFTLSEAATLPASKYDPLPPVCPLSAAGEHEGGRRRPVQLGDDGLLLLGQW